MLLKNIIKTISAICIVLFMASCAEVSSNGAIAIEGQPATIELTEVSTDGVTPGGIDITINSEFIGTAEYAREASKSGTGSQNAFAPVPSKYGEIRIVQNISGNNVNFDVFVAGDYAGNVNFYTFTGIL